MKKRAFSVIVALTIYLAIFHFPSIAAAENAPQALPDNALHFIVRHWHSEEDTDAVSHPNDTSAGNRYFVVVEGYIVPDNGAYSFYLVSPGDTSDGRRAGERIKINADFVSGSDYIEAIDPQNGAVTLKAKPLVKNGNTPLENFSAFSVSAGHGAVTSGENSLTITYDPYVHLVKAHAFYIRATMEVSGTQDETVFGSAGAEADQQDTAWAYTYTKDFTDSDGVFHKKGEIVRDNEGNPVREINDPNAEENMELTKVYNTAEGLHTDKTAHVNPDANDGRTFDLELEAWFSRGYPPQIGMILDASGSMAFASDIPSRIQLTEKQIQELEISTLPDTAAESGEPSGGWEHYFLTPRQLDQILNPHNTDNSTLSVSGYSYFVLNGSEYAPLGYWEGVDTSYSFEDTDSSPSGIINGNNGFQTGGSSGTALLLDAQPTSSAFTVSFMIRKGGSTPAKDSANIAELMYIGPLSGDADKSSFFTLYREGSSNSEARLKGNQQAGRGNNITNINSVFNNAVDYRVTLVFDGEKLTSYVNGAVGNSGSGAADLVSGVQGVNEGSDYTLDFENTGDIRIILGGIRDNYGGGKLWIDDVYVFDRALDRTAVGNIANETDKLIGRYMFDKGDNSLKNSAGNVNTYAAVLEQIVLMSAGDNTIYSSPGPAIAKTQDGRILGSLNIVGSDATAAPTLHHKQAGWYFITHSGQYDNHYKLIGTGKRLVGLSGTQTYKGVEGVNVRDLVTGCTYTNKETDTPIRFYVDANGDLLCFFSASIGDSKCSYVYELKDGEYVRTESLQRALGVFVTELNEFTPAARVSAVRFSTDNIRDLSELVLSDWTDDPSESTAVLSLERGSGSEKGTATGSALSSANGLNQYNYGLTGSTSTWRGLQAYIDYLMEYDDPYEGASVDVPKYLIIFTDGADSDHNGNKSEEERGKALALANQLKNDNDYTVFTVLLDGGAMSDESYANAEEFLLSLAGKSVYDDPEDNVNNYFFSVHKAKEELGSAAAGMNDADILMQIFVDRILEEIVDPLENYTVKDYIDPRFDLVDGEGVVWRLNADGSVIRSDGEMITVGSALDTQITLSESSDEIARYPYLCYDSDVQLYYLRWADQIIPASAVGANRLAVWNARVTLRAKDDFLGGNAVLTNGNAAAQNLVFSSDDAAPSSGTDRANDRNNPSKGFPRVTVNVQPLGAEQEKELTVYMGEKISMETVLADLMERAVAEGWYCWEYLARYEDVQGAAEELAEAFIRGYEADGTFENTVFEIPYFYLGEAGSDMHRADGLGTMIYSVEPPADKLLLSRTGWTLKTNDAINAVFRAAYTPFDAHERKTANDTLVTEKNSYLWDEDYKPAAGTAAERTDAVVSDRIEVVSGEIALQVLVSDEAAAKLQSIRETVTYTADLYWDSVRVGTFIAEISADTLTDKTVNAVIKYDDTDDFDRAAYGLPLGTYTVKSGHSAAALPLGFSFGDIMLSETKSDYLPDLFSQGTGSSTPENYIAAVSGKSFILGGRDVGDRLYTDQRFGLAQVELEYTETLQPSNSPTSDTAPKTGDAGQLGQWAAIMILSLAGIAAILSLKGKL